MAKKIIHLNDENEDWLHGKNRKDKSKGKDKDKDDGKKKASAERIVARIVAEKAPDRG